jgi:hypothetical protein
MQKSEWENARRGSESSGKHPVLLEAGGLVFDLPVMQGCRRSRRRNQLGVSASHILPTSSLCPCPITLTAARGKHACNAVNDFGHTAVRVLEIIYSSLVSPAAPIFASTMDTPDAHERPHGWKFWVVFASICSCTFLTGLDVVSFANACTLFQLLNPSLQGLNRNCPSCHNS